MPKKEQLLQTGKLPSEILNGLLSTITYDDERIIIGPRIGEDAAVIDYGDRECLLQKQTQSLSQLNK